MYNSAKAVLKGIRTNFAMQVVGQNESMFNAFIEQVTSNSDKEDYFFFDALPRIKEWKDEISTKDFKDFKYEILNKDWEVATRVDRNTLDDSKSTLGNDLTIWIKRMAQEYKDFQDVLIQDLLIANGKAFDGTAYFANSRPNLQGSNTIDNLNAGTGTTLAQLSADLQAARTSLRSFKDKSGRPFNRNLKLGVLVPAQLEQNILSLANNELIDLGSGPITNTVKGTFEVIVNDIQSITDNDWYVMNLNAPFKQFIYQTRKAPEWFFEDMKSKKFIDYFATSRSNAGYGNPTSIVKIDN